MSGFQKILKRSELGTLQSSASNPRIQNVSISFILFLLSLGFSFSLNLGYLHNGQKKTAWLLLQCPIAVWLHFRQQIKSSSRWSKYSNFLWTVLLSGLHQRVPWKSVQGQWPFYPNTSSFSPLSPIGLGLIKLSAGNILNNPPENSQDGWWSPSPLQNLLKMSFSYTYEVPWLSFSLFC